METNDVDGGGLDTGYDVLGVKWRRRHGEEGNVFSLRKAFLLSVLAFYVSTLAYW